MAVEGKFEVIQESSGNGKAREVLKFAGREVDVAECLGSDPCLDGRESSTAAGVQDMISAVHARVATGGKRE